MATASNMAYQETREMIIKGELIPGQRVSQVKLAQKFGCSTVPVVEAMRRLESEGLLVKEGRKMAKVRQLSVNEIEGLYLIREGLEAIAARLCAERISESELDKLQDLVEKFEAAVASGHHKVLGELEIKIHHCIADNANCSLLLEELSRLLLIEKTITANMQLTSQRQYRHSHRTIVEAIADRDGDSAEYLMKKHIQNGYRELLEQIRK
jgi:DNA-binding GntR family transcriptional regulator